MVLSPVSAIPVWLRKSSGCKHWLRSNQLGVLPIGLLNWCYCCNTKYLAAWQWLYNRGLQTVWRSLLYKLLIVISGRVGTPKVSWEESLMKLVNSWPPWQLWSFSSNLSLTYLGGYRSHFYFIPDELWSRNERY